MEAMWWIERVIYLGFALFGVWMFVNLLRNHLRHEALSKRMSQYSEWIKGYKDMSPEDKKIAEGIAQKVFAGGFDYRGPWEDQS